MLNFICILKYNLIILMYFEVKFGYSYVLWSTMLWFWSTIILLAHNYYMDYIYDNLDFFIVFISPIFQSFPS